MYVDAKRPHTHDVRVLLMLAPAGQAALLLSAGNDAQLVLHQVNSFTRQHPTRVCRVPEPPLVAAPPMPPANAQGHSAVMATAQRDVMDVWRINVAASRQQTVRPRLVASISGAEVAPIIPC